MYTGSNSSKMQFIVIGVWFCRYTVCMLTEYSDNNENTYKYNGLS